MSRLRPPHEGGRDAPSPLLPWPSAGPAGPRSTELVIGNRTGLAAHRRPGPVTRSRPPGLDSPV